MQIEGWWGERNVKLGVLAKNGCFLVELGKNMVKMENYSGKTNWKAKLPPDGWRTGGLRPVEPEKSLGRGILNTRKIFAATNVTNYSYG